MELKLLLERKRELGSGSRWRGVRTPAPGLIMEGAPQRRCLRGGPGALMVEMFSQHTVVQEGCGPAVAAREGARPSPQAHRAG